MSSYASFPSIERLENIYCVISEKIDGTNGLIEVDIADEWHKTKAPGESIVRFGSRNRYITFENDNAGFANFFRHYIAKFEDVATNIISREREISGETLTDCNEKYPLRIYGEWFGSGIQRGYGLKDKFFMPFSTYYAEKLIEYQVPNIIKPNILYTGKFDLGMLNTCMTDLKLYGSKVIPDFGHPEGVVIYFPKYNFRLKNVFPNQEKTKTEHDQKPKQDIQQCPTCSKRLYAVKDGSGIPKCMNIHCTESPNYKS